LDKLVCLENTFLAIPTLPLLASFWSTSECKSNKKTGARNHPQNCCCYQCLHCRHRCCSAAIKIVAIALATNIFGTAAAAVVAGEGRPKGQCVFCCKAHPGRFILIAVVDAPLMVSASMLLLSPLPFSLLFLFLSL
jgi:hypothetical protein